MAQIMGVVNVTPDSFSDGGSYADLASAVAHAKQLVAEGATMIDVGGESTRPGAAPVSVTEELARVIPVIVALRQAISVPISIDTSKPEVMVAAVRAGATLINDVYALRLPGARRAAQQCGVPICLVHMQGDPRSMQQAPRYTDVVEEVKQFFIERIAACKAAGITDRQLILDPGIGFGKTLSHNLQLLNQLVAFKSFDLPLLVGVSRKAMIGSLLDKPVDQRLYGSVAAATWAVTKGADIIRTHDVVATAEAVRVTRALMNGTVS